MGRLDGRVAVITGGGDGIGAGIARRFAEEGARVLIAELNENNGRATADELAARSEETSPGVTVRAKGELTLELKLLSPEYLPTS